MTFPARNVDVYMADMERIEVLEGPQGTLFGGGAEAGVIRYITNKPKLNVTEGNVEASYGVTAQAATRTQRDRGAQRAVDRRTRWRFAAVIYNDRRGGYIDNVPSKFTRMNTDPGDHYYQLGGRRVPERPAAESQNWVRPGQQPSANNYSLAGPPRTRSTTPAYASRRSGKSTTTGTC